MHCENLMLALSVCGRITIHSRFCVHVCVCDCDCVCACLQYTLNRYIKFCSLIIKRAAASIWQDDFALHLAKGDHKQYTVCSLYGMACIANRLNR